MSEFGSCNSRNRRGAAAALLTCCELQQLDLTLEIANWTWDRIQDIYTYPFLL
jgi:hypothetical protein